jgi:hypothetical protein
VEFLYVSPEGQVHYDFADREPLTAHPQEIHGTNRPEPLQTWTVTAMLEIKSKTPARLAGRSLRESGGEGGRGWTNALEADLLTKLPLMQPLRTAVEREAVYARRGDFVLNTEFGVERDQAARASGAAQSSSEANPVSS